MKRPPALSDDFGELFESHIERFGTVPAIMLMEMEPERAVRFLRAALARGTALTETELGLPPGALT